MSYGPAGYEDDWDDEQFDFGDEYDPEYSTVSSYPASTKYTDNATNVKSYDTPKTYSKTRGGFGTPPKLKSSFKESAGRGRGKCGGFPSKSQNNIQSKKDASSKKNKGQRDVLFARSKDKT